MSFQCRAAHLLPVMRENRIDLSLFLFNFIIDVSPSRVILGSETKVIPVMSLSTLSIDVQYEFRHGQVQNTQYVSAFLFQFHIWGRAENTEALFCAAWRGHNVMRLYCVVLCLVLKEKY